MVLSQNTETGEKGYKEVTSTSSFYSSAWIEVTTENEQLTATRNHPFWVIKGDDFESGEWVEAGGLDRGMKLIDSSGSIVEITEVRRLYEEKKTYNFEVADWQAYFVGENELLVHNGGECSLPVTQLNHPGGAVGSYDMNRPYVIAVGSGPYVLDPSKNIILEGRTVSIKLTNDANGGVYFQTNLAAHGFTIDTSISQPSSEFNKGKNIGAAQQLVRSIWIFMGGWSGALQNAPSNQYVPSTGSSLNSPSNAKPMPHNLNMGTRYTVPNVDQTLYMPTR